MSEPPTRPVQPSFPSSLCHRCAHARRVESAKGSVFLRCGALPEKYPRQPVLHCPEFRCQVQNTGE